MLQLVDKGQNIKRQPLSELIVMLNGDHQLTELKENQKNQSETCKETRVNLSWVMIALYKTGRSQ